MVFSSGIASNSKELKNPTSLIFKKTLTHQRNIINTCLKYICSFCMTFGENMIQHIAIKMYNPLQKLRGSVLFFFNHYTKIFQSLSKICFNRDGKYL